MIGNQECQTEFVSHPRYKIGNYILFLISVDECDSFRDTYRVYNSVRVYCVASVLSLTAQDNMTDAD